MKKSNILTWIMCLLVMACESDPAGLAYYHSVGYPKNVSENYIIAKKGEDLASIANKYKVNRYELATINNLRPPYNISEGKKIYLPKFKIHKVRYGETLHSIARYYGTEIGVVAKANNIKYPFEIERGMTIKIPQNFVSKAELEAMKSIDAKTYDSAPKMQIKQHNISSAPSFENNYNIANLESRTENNPVKKLFKKEKVSHKISFVWPVKSRKVIDSFGQKAKGIRNDGINISAEKNTDVVAVEEGKVVYSGNDLDSYGNLVIIMHENGYASSYAHLDNVVVDKGIKVKKGEVIGKVGNTGIVKEPQLHFSLRKGKRAINPLSMLKKS